MTKMIQALVLSAFEDATTGEQFAEGKTVPLERGVFDNFEAAGLVREADPAPSPTPAAKPTSRKRPRAAT
jgi:hypothetical protein